MTESEGSWNWRRNDIVLPDFPCLNTFSTVLFQVHIGHLADTPGLSNPYVLAAVTVAWHYLIYLEYKLSVSFVACKQDKYAIVIMLR